MLKRCGLFAFLSAMALAAGQVQAAVVLPVSAYTKPDQPVVVKFLNEKGDEGKKAVAALGVSAGKLDWLFTPAASADIASGGTAAFKLYSADGKEVKVSSVTPAADGTVDLSAACPDLKNGGTWFLVWKDATPLVIETLYNPGRGKAELDRIKSQIEMLPDPQKSQRLAEYAPVVTHVELAEVAVITTDKGVIRAKFAYDVAPHTVDNFISLSRQGFYDGSTFHRIISGFMIQGGDAYTDGKAGTGGPGNEIMHEFSDKKHERGTLSMARASSPDSAGSQFFIMHARTASLDNSYSAFGDVVAGMDIVDAIAKTPTSDENGTVSGAKPKIVSVKIEPGTAEVYGLKK